MSKKEDDVDIQTSVNLATYLLLPLIELSENSFGENGSNYVNTYLTNEGYIAVEIESWNRLMVTAINTQFYFTDFELNNGNHMILYKIKGSNLDDLVKFRQGKYSQLSQIAKNKIMIFNGLKDKDEFVRILNADLKLREKLAKELGVPIDWVTEAKSKPSSSNFIDISLYQSLIPTEDVS